MFTNLNSYLINSDNSSEERLHIPEGYNVYVLPVNLFRAGSRLMAGPMIAFINMLHSQRVPKRIYWVRDECHIETKNLNVLAKTCFDATINFSATPKLERGQHPDITITDEDAEEAMLIKRVEWGDDSASVGDAIDKLASIKDEYNNLLGVNPCLLIQISNKEKADEELSQTIMPALAARQKIKWMLIVGDDRGCDTNDAVKKKKASMEKWKKLAKSNRSTIDVIVFKMVISEGWDIPRACMLYQERQSRSEQLDKQVVGRIRRNPRLTDFERLGDRARELATTAWAWGIKPKGGEPFGVKLRKGVSADFSVRTTRLENLTEKAGFDYEEFLKEHNPPIVQKSIFEIYSDLRQSDAEIKNIVYDYADDYQKWRRIATFSKELQAKNRKLKCNYENSMVEGDTVSFPITSYYTDAGKYERIADWVWMRRDPELGDEDRFSFDSDTERKWAAVLTKLARGSAATLDAKKASLEMDAAQTSLYDEGDDDGNVYLWGKNYPPQSGITFEYYTDTTHSSYPDFVMKDIFGRIHIFEVKSVNELSHSRVDREIYEKKILELRKCYKQASLLTGQIFYIPVLKGNVWTIDRYRNGEEDTQTYDMFVKSVKNAT
jgi:type III restriction enzyme